MTSTTSSRRFVFVLGTGPQESATVAALRLADEAGSRGHQVAVYAYADAVRVAAQDCPTGRYVAALLERNPDEGRVAWIVDGDDPRAGTQVEGVVRGDGSDLWRLVREGDVVLGVTA